MIEALGSYSFSVAILVAAGAVLASVAAVRFQSDRALLAARWSIGVIALCLTVASGALLAALLKSDFRFEYVAGYTERALPLGYKIAAFWAGQEGSLLLWAWLLAILCLVAAIIGLGRQRTEQAVANAVMAVVCGFFAVLLLFPANPFTQFDGAVPADGHGLNPMLQDPGMIIHPPLLFLGYAAFTIPFALMIGMLVAGRDDNRWLGLIRRWLLVSWVFLTAGIVLGAWWAYVELGWGGYWAWDPVENASLLPWLTSTALLHSIMIQQHRGMFKIWNVTLIALSFILCIFGTYLTRSGVISSVHAFAPSAIGTLFLIFLLLCVVGSVGLIIWRWPILKARQEMEGLISREGAFLLGNVILLVMMLTTTIGTIWPLISNVFGDPVTVKTPFYNQIVAPMGLLLALVMAHGPVLAFGKSAAGKIARAMTIPGIVAIIVTAIVAATGTYNIWALICTFIAILGTCTVIVSFVRTVSARCRSTGEGLLIAAIRLIDADKRRYGGQLAHLGMILVIVGVAGSSLYKTENIHRLRPGESVQTDAFQLTFVSLDEVREANFTAVQATVTVTDQDGGVTTTLTPQRRYYDTRSQEPNSEVAIHSTLRRDLYLTLAGWEAGGSLAVIEVRVTPLVLWIWLGGIVMTAGGVYCTLPRLIPKAARAHAHVAEPADPGAQAQPAPILDTAALETEATS